MRTSNRTTVCTGECPECPVADLGVRGTDAVNDTVGNYYGGDRTGFEHEEFDELLAGLAVDAAISGGLDREDIKDQEHPIVEHAPAVAAAATRVIMNECTAVQL
jgi:hypothetical protein